jgi:predicted nucleotidyltransferase
MFESLFAALSATGVRYVVVGGVAAVLHGHVRLTADVDLVIDLAPAEAKRLIGALVEMGFLPRAPVDALDFADAAIRAAWKADKGMQVFSMVDRANPMRVVDIFVDHPLEFDGLWDRADVVTVGATPVRIASIEDLIALKRLAGRPQDLADIERLEEILRRRGPRS